MDAGMSGSWEQDPLNLGLPEEPQRPPARKVKAPKGGYVRQERLSDPPMCGLCIDEMHVTKTRPVAAPNRSSHVAWLPGWPTQVRMCAAHAMDFAATHGLGRVRVGR